MRVYAAAESLSVLEVSTSALFEPHSHHDVIGVVEVAETEVLVETDGTLVPGVDSEMDPGHSPGPKLIEETGHHLSTHTSPLQDRKQVDVEMGRKSSHNFVGRAFRVVDQGDDLGVVD